MSEKEQAEWEIRFVDAMNERLEVLFTHYLINKGSELSVEVETELARFVDFVKKDNIEGLDAPRGREGTSYRQRAAS